MILLIGQVGRDMSDREAFQEIDYRQMFGPVAKWAAQIDRTERIPEYMARAFHLATSGRPGPIVLALPEDMLTEESDVPDAKPFLRVQAAASASEVAAVGRLLAEAEKPLLLVGGADWSDDACRQIVAFAESNELPAATSFRRQDIFDNRSRCFAGDLGTSGPPALIKRVKEADLLLVVGARLGEMTTQGYSVMDVTRPRQKVIHIHPNADEIGRVFTPDIGIASSSDAFAAAIGTLNIEGGGSRWRAWREAARGDYLDAVAPPAASTFDLDMAAALAAYRHEMPVDAIVTLDAGNHTGWPQRYLQFGRPGREIGPTSGAMGYSVPAAVAASIVHPDRLVIGCVGDGGFMMSGAEIATAVQHGARPIILLFNNNMYGTIRMHQEREHPERVVGTDLVNPDFVAMARSMGAYGELVTRTDEFRPALERAVAAGRAALIELQTDPEQVSTRLTIKALRERARAAR